MLVERGARLMGVGIYDSYCISFARGLAFLKERTGSTIASLQLWALWDGWGFLFFDFMTWTYHI